MKKFKGMSLLEIVVAMAVLMIIALMLVVGCQSAVTNARISKTVSDKCATQAPVASTHNADDADRTEMKIKLTSDKGGSGDMNVYSYEVKDGEDTTKDRSGNYRYFVLKK